MGRPNRAATIFLSTVIAVLGVIVVSLSIPLPVWRTGRLEAPPLDLVSGGQLVSRSSRIWIDTDAACGATPTTDPDDCLAIVWLAANGPTIVGLSSSYGNANADVVERTTEALVAAMGTAGSRESPSGAAQPVPSRIPPMQRRRPTRRFALSWSRAHSRFSPWGP